MSKENYKEKNKKNQYHHLEFFPLCEFSFGIPFFK